ncbi:cell division protein SepF [bacterium 210820-DFI.6.52]|uniref:Cell division protein SepF n=1 Tax=Bittarella massiliensis (ex Durand et al. 2017) TaxID=1720313 RepID=A0AAQ1RUZ3_9FIRM|nr:MULTISPECIES: cell division protein SepF [Eubacteriales]MCB5941006.1 cell division protein SepF [bacterium 210820-DFI.6.52]ERJ00492.1 putative cell division protein SepF [Clostridium sp. ATCC 29733]MZL68793.1 cell division protein SepF [Bittarella massiliensis (ex Durand et al. 2017)]MZL81249.1 cell division protein SepF [Bittarella massiliensis (ex Durand et al. 2017)]SHF72152.1 cell division inhibitor SepF [Bittarella massiliensis (ex Durand et al. 2017)]
MGLVDKFKDFMGMDSDEEGYEEDFEGTGEVDFLSGTPSAKKQEETTVVGYDEVASKRNKVVNINTTAQLQVVLVKPEKFEDASAVADHLNAKRTVVLNLEGTNKDISRRLVDFLSGVAYANNGQIQRVANSTFIITPYNVDLVGDLMDELENNGIFF